MFAYAWDSNHNPLEADASNERDPGDPRRSFLFPRAAMVRNEYSESDSYSLQETELQETESDDPDMLEFLLAGEGGYDPLSSAYLDDILGRYTGEFHVGDEYINYYPGEEYNVYPNTNQGIANSLSTINTQPTSSLTNQNILSRPTAGSSSTSLLPVSLAASRSGNGTSITVSVITSGTKSGSRRATSSAANTFSSATTTASRATITISSATTTASSARHTITSIAATTSLATTEAQSTNSEVTHPTSSHRSASATTPSLITSIPTPTPSLRDPTEDEDEQPPPEDAPAQPPPNPAPDAAGAAGGAAGAAGGAAGAAGGLLGGLDSVAGVAAGAAGAVGLGAIAGGLAANAGGHGSGNTKIQPTSSSTPTIQLLADVVSQTGHLSTPSQSLAAHPAPSGTSTSGALPNPTSSSSIRPSTSATATATSARRLRNGAQSVVLPPAPLASKPPPTTLSGPTGPPIVLAGLRSAAALLALPIPLTHNYAANAPPHTNPPHAQLPQCVTTSSPPYAPAAHIAPNATITTACSGALNATAFDALIDAIYADVQAGRLPPFPFKVPWIYAKEVGGVRWNYTTVGLGGGEGVFLGALDYFNYLRYAGWANAGIANVNAAAEVGAHVRERSGASVARVEVCEAGSGVWGCLGRAVDQGAEIRTNVGRVEAGR
ncbi:hypothetical protein MMC15_003850 [Xylographa vitiligo]|nr:hypothetical protein [Xylographa vitiligo]